MTTQKVHRGTLLFLTIYKTAIKKIWFATSVDIMNFVHLIEILTLLKFLAFLNMKIL